jgi:hypothetical protein
MEVLNLSNKASQFINIEHRLRSLKKRANQKNIEFNLNKVWIKEKLKNGVCEATGIPFSLDRTPFVNPFYPSVDRIDTTKGYTKDNCKLVCQIYNLAKADHSIEIIETWCKKFVEQYERTHETLL